MGKAQMVLWITPMLLALRVPAKDLDLVFDKFMSLNALEDLPTSPEVYLKQIKQAIAAVKQ
jgi:hypothetical protein